MKYNLSEIMHKAWKLYRKGTAAFAECLHRAWNSAKAQPINAQRISEAQTAAGVTEEVNTWAGWRAAGCEVLHGAKALFQVVLIHSSKRRPDLPRVILWSVPSEAPERLKQTADPAEQEKPAGIYFEGRFLQ